MLPKEVSIICKIDIVKYLLNRPILQERLIRWPIKLYAFALNYAPLRAIKELALADFLAEHLCMEINDPLSKVNNYVQLELEALTFDRSRSQKDVRVEITITSLRGRCFRFISQLNHEYSNKQAEYATLIIRLKILISMKAFIS